MTAAYCRTWLRHAGADQYREADRNRAENLTYWVLQAPHKHADAATEFQ
jgi:hypothetical protein